MVSVSDNSQEWDFPCENCQRPGIVQMITYEMLYAIIKYDISAKFYDTGFRQIRRDVGTGRIVNHPGIENLVPRKKT